MPNLDPRIIAMLLQMATQQENAQLTPQITQQGGDPLAIALQQANQSQVSSQIPRPLGVSPGLDNLNDAVIQGGILKNQQRQRDASAIQNSLNIPFKQSPVDIDSLKRAQGLNLSRF